MTSHTLTNCMYMGKKKDFSGVIVIVWYLPLYMKFYMQIDCAGFTPMHNIICSSDLPMENHLQVKTFHLKGCTNG